MMLMKVMLLLPTLLPFLNVALGVKMKVISTDAGASLPAKDGRAEMVNSSLVKLSEVTLCARFLTHSFSTDLDGSPIQTAISYGTDDLLSSYLARPCDNPQSYQEHSKTRQPSRAFLAFHCVFMAYKCKSVDGSHLSCHNNTLKGTKCPK